MKRLFEEPRLELEAFAISDSTLFLSGVGLGENELDPVTGAYNVAPITPEE